MVCNVCGTEGGHDNEAVRLRLEWALRRPIPIDPLGLRHGASSSFPLRQCSRPGVPTIQFGFTAEMLDHPPPEGVVSQTEDAEDRVEHLESPGEEPTGVCECCVCRRGGYACDRCGMRPLRGHCLPTEVHYCQPRRNRMGCWSISFNAYCAVFGRAPLMQLFATMGAVVASSWARFRRTWYRILCQ